MLRLISIIGIAIAMVIGFVALSSNMKDDYTVRSRVVDVLKQMKEMASRELQCDTTNNSVPEVEIPIDSESTSLTGSPDTLLDNSSPTDQPITEDTASEESQESMDDVRESGNPQLEKQSSDFADMENTTIEHNTDIIKTMGYKALESGHVEVIVIFKDVRGESGKTKIKSDSRIVITCSCDSQALSCRTVESNINKNYLPKSLTK